MCSQHRQAEYDQAKAAAFAGRLLTALNNGALCLMVSVGHRTGLFDVMSQSTPATSEEIAVRARLNERYVREWLGAMVTAGVVRVDPGSRCCPRSRRTSFRSSRDSRTGSRTAFACSTSGVAGSHREQARRVVPAQPVRRDGSLARGHRVWRGEASAKGLDNVEFVAADVSDFDETAEPESFDVITTF